MRGGTPRRAARAALVLVCALAGGLIVAAPRPARAEGAIYDDVRAVIEEIIQAEVAGQVAITVRTRSPALAVYFDDTLERLASPYWGSLADTLRRDLVSLIADYVYWELAADGPARSHGLVAFARCLGRTDDPACRELAEAHRRATTAVELRCRSLTAALSPTRRVACDLALATRAALARQQATAVRHVIDAVADVLLYDVDDPAIARSLRGVALAWLRQPEGTPARFAELWIDAAPPEDALTPEAIQARCADRDAAAAFVEQAGGERVADRAALGYWVCFALSSAALPDALAFDVTLDKGGQEIAVKLRSWEVEGALAALAAREGDDGIKEHQLWQLFADEAAEASCARRKAAAATGEVPWIACLDGKLGGVKHDGLGVAVATHGRTFAARVDGTGKYKASSPLALVRFVKRYRRAAARIDEMRRMVPPELADALFVRDAVAIERSAPALRGVLRIGRLVASLRARWYLWPSDAMPDADRLATMDLGGLIAVALELGGGALEQKAPGLARLRRELGGAAEDAGAAATAATTTTTTATTAAATAAATVEAELDLVRLMGLAFRAEYRELAVESLRAALADRARIGPYETFFVSLSAYLLDDPGQVTADLTRGAFRAAARDLLRTIEDEGVPSSDHRVRLAPWPRLSLRVGFGDSFAYDGEAEPSSRRIGAAAEWPTFLVAATDHAGLELSVIDLLAPLQELALRPVGDYRDERWVALDLVRPRAGVYVALPELSKHLVASAGAGARLIELVEDDAATGGRPSGRYRRSTSLVLDLGVSFVF